MDYDFTFKILVIGDSGVGKSSLLRRFVDNNYLSEHSSTIGVDFKIKTMQIDGFVVKLQMWDTAGQERFRSLGTSYFKGSHGVFLVTDITSVESFHNCSSVWLPLIKENLTGENVALVFLFNKCDLVDDIKIGDDVLNQLLYPYYKVSAKESVNIFEPFEMMVRKMINIRKISYFPKDPIGNSQTIHYHEHVVRIGDAKNKSSCKC